MNWFRWTTYLMLIVGTSSASWALQVAGGIPEVQDIKICKTFKVKGNGWNKFEFVAGSSLEGIVSENFGILYCGKLRINGGDHDGCVGMEGADTVIIGHGRKQRKREVPPGAIEFVPKAEPNSTYFPASCAFTPGHLTIAEAREQFVALLFEILRYREDPEFLRVGFAIGHPYNQWMTKVETLSGNAPQIFVYPDHPFVIRELLMLGLQFVQHYGQQTEYSMFLAGEMCPALPEIINGPESPDQSRLKRFCEGG